MSKEKQVQLNWAGFSGSEGDLSRYLASLKAWATRLACKRRRVDLTEEIEGKALEYLVERNQMGSTFDRSLEQFVVKECQIADSYVTKRDGDLSAAIEDFQGSFIDEFIVDKKSENIEDRILGILDCEEIIEEGKDQSELEQEANEACYFLSLRDETLLSLKYQFSYTQHMLGAYFDRHQSTISLWQKKAIARQKLFNECQELLNRASQDRMFTQLTIAWIRL